ncbi:hypothetical protein C2S53_010419 [Perilla frutescens var. hirtella]|uniref:Retrotransposon gag domain-containing protein n=1 Tax=Perilla frutescens var. hirtella TaxID=608512 RepID=A0AAD4P926_PERFH|nr:hypothetical protein C2S53_010419 [Perilla frutescens var. hirtella]
MMSAQSSAMKTKSSTAPTSKNSTTEKSVMKTKISSTDAPDSSLKSVGNKKSDEAETGAAPLNTHLSTSYPLEEFVMMADGSTTDEQIANLTKLMEQMYAYIKRQHDQIARLLKGKEVMSQENHEENSENNGNETPEKPEMNDDAKSSAKELNVSVDGSIPINQLKEFIEGTIKDRFGYQPLKFQQFDGKGNPRQHVAHFVETYNNAGTYGDYLVKKFVRSLKRNAFDCTRRTVSMVELTSSRQWKEEPVIDYINRWRNLCLNCKDRLSEASAIEMCIQGMHWGLQYFLRGIQPRTFEELATRAHDMELSMAASGIDGPPMQEPRKFKERQDFKRSAKSFDKVPKKESMATKATFIKFIRKDADKDTKQNVQPEKKMHLKEMQQKQFPFLDSDVLGIFDDLLKEGLIELPEMKRSNEAARTDDPKYCKYHRLVRHPIHDCFILKDKIMQLARQEKISLEEDDATTSIVITESSNAVNDEEDDKRVKKETHVADNDYISAITFTDEDLQLGSDPHNRPLFMSGYACEKLINRILIDGGSAVNILPLRTLKELEFPMEDLSVVKTVVGDHKPFTEAESYFADSKYYLSNTKTTKGAEVHQKELGSGQKIKKKAFGIESLEGLTLPLTKIDTKKPITPPLKGFIRPTQGGATEHGESVNSNATQHFGPKAFKLLVKAGYSPQESPVTESRSKVVDQQNYGLNATQKMLKKNGHVVPSTKAGLGLVPQSPVCITIKRATTNHVFEGEFLSTEDAVGKFEKKTLKTSVFKRLGKTPRVSVFKRLGRKCGGKITKVESSNGFDKP